MERVTIDRLAIEVTRRCNMSCEHCMRGEPEDLDMTRELIGSLFSKVDSIGTLIFGGGESSLVPEVIEMIVECARFYGVSIGNFDVTTNGSQITSEFLVAMIHLYEFCHDNEISSLAWSDDVFHCEEWREGERLLRALSFAGPRNNDSLDWTGKEVLKEGRAGIDSEAVEGRRPVSRETFQEGELDDDRVMDGVVYLNCEGKVIAGCDWSYESQRFSKNIICHVDDFGIDKVRAYVEAEAAKKVAI